MGGYFNVIATWLDGESTSSLELFGRTMFWWGRAGKLMLFLAGLAIALDLINPARLRARGRAAMDRSQAYLARSRLYRDRSRMIALRRAIQRDIYSLQPMSDRYVTYPNLAISWPPGAVPRRLAMPLPAYRAFYRETVGALRQEHACPTQHLHVCWEQVAFANHRVDELIFERLPKSREVLMPMLQAGQEDGSVWRRLPVVFVWLQLAVTAGLVILMLHVAQSVMWSAIVAAFGYTATGIVASDRMRLLVAALTYRVGGSSQRAVGRVLQRARRLHFFRWIALTLFIVGSHFDLLAA